MATNILNKPKPKPVDVESFGSQISGTNLIPIYTTYTPSAPAPTRGGGIMGIGGFGSAANDYNSALNFGMGNGPPPQKTSKVLVGYKSATTGERYNLAANERNLPAYNTGQVGIGMIGVGLGGNNYLEPKNDPNKMKVIDRIQLEDTKVAYKQELTKAQEAAAIKREEFAQQAALQKAEYEKAQADSAAELVRQKEQFEKDTASRQKAREEADALKKANQTASLKLSGETMLGTMIRQSEFRDNMVSQEDKTSTITNDQKTLADQETLQKQKLKGTFLDVIMKGK
jgi:hypothetical protein